MFELVNALHEGEKSPKSQVSNSIGVGAGCELFIEFVTLFPHDSAVCLVIACHSSLSATLFVSS
jgi:hypothetical protein